MNGMASQIAGYFCIYVNVSTLINDKSFSQVSIVESLKVDATFLSQR